MDWIIGILEKRSETRPVNALSYRTRGIVIGIAVLVAIGLGIWWMMVPRVMVGGVAGPETKAIGALKAYGGAQYLYREKFGKFAILLNTLSKPFGDRPCLLEPAIAEADGREGKTYPGYIFFTPDYSIEHLDWQKEYSLVAQPAEYDKTAVLTFYTDQQGLIWMKDLYGRRLDRLPADPAAEGWVNTGD